MRRAGDGGAPGLPVGAADAPTGTRRQLGRSALGVLAVLGAGLVGGCGAGPVPRPTPTPMGSAPSVSIPDDGAPLAEFGFTHGPVTAWSLPARAAVTDRVDQPNQLTMVVTSPGPEAIVDYLVRALPPAGFTIEHQRRAGDDSALIATGYGWRGSVVGASSGRTLVTLQNV